MRRCLVIEDSDSVRNVVQEAMAAFGYDVTTAADAASGLKKIGDEVPEVVLLDWDLPSKGALDFLTGIAESTHQPKPTTILMATENEPRVFALARAAGASFYILKPFDRQDLADVLKRAGMPASVAA